MRNLTSQLRKANEVQVVPATVLASIIGKVLSMALALGPVARLMTRNLYAMLNARSSWYQTLSITREARAELAFWLEHIEKFNGQNMWPGPSGVRVFYSDASSTGYGDTVSSMATRSQVTRSQLANGCQRRPFGVQHGGNLEQ